MAQQGGDDTVMTPADAAAEAPPPPSAATPTRGGYVGSPTSDAIPEIGPTSVATGEADPQSAADADPQPAAEADPQLGLPGSATPGAVARRAAGPFFPAVDREKSPCPRVTRREINAFLEYPTWWRHFHTPKKQAIVKKVADLARGTLGRKTGDIKTTVCGLQQSALRSLPINLAPLSARTNLECSSGIFDYRPFALGAEGAARAREERPMIVDFANKHLGGGAFGQGFVQEEQMVIQSLDFVVRLCKCRDNLHPNQVLLLEGIHFDAWWDRQACAAKTDIRLDQIQHIPTVPLSIIAADAIPMKGYRFQETFAIEALAKKLALIFATAESGGCTTLYSGLLGGGAFRNNRPLICLLHMLLTPPDWGCKVVFHHPIFWSFTDGVHESELERRILEKAEELRIRLVREFEAKGCLNPTIIDAIRALGAMRLPLSEKDKDLK
eukprot:Hpha_TRINITY_DN16853_c3_g4::TRINITY_DN16853_c3_g4_i1::g.150496::m.150496